MNNDVRNQLIKLVELYARTKLLMLKAEEFNPILSKTYLQPRLELFQAFDHLMSDCIIPIINDDEVNLESVIKHVVTSFFDIADWTMMIIWEHVNGELKNFNSETIATAIPNYYSMIRPELEQLKDDITEIRAKKVHETLEDTEKYIDHIEKTYDYIKAIQRAKGTLLELQRKSRFKTWIGPIVGLISILISIIIAILSKR